MGRVRSVVMVSLLLGLLLVPGARAEQAIDDDPTISGPAHTVEHVVGFGWDGDLVRTIAEGQGRAEINGAEWGTTVSPGRYEVAAWIPRDYGGTYVRYLIKHRGGESEVRLRQAGHADVWVTLGTFDIDDPVAVVRSTDSGGIAGETMVWDAIRWTKVETQPASPDPSADEHVVDEPVVTGPQEYLTTFVGVGFDGDLIRTYTEGADHDQLNGAEWRTPTTPGRFRVQVYIPSEHAESLVRYFVTHAEGEREVLIDQSRYSNAWVDLGDFSIAGPDGVVRSTDATGIRAMEMAWDAVRWVRLPPAVQSAPSAPPASDPAPAPDPAPAAAPAPDGSADPDLDGMPNVLDACDQEHRGSLDSNGDGCPGPVKVLPRQRRRIIDATEQLRPGGPLLAFRVDDLRVTRPSKSKVRLRCGPCLFLVERRGANGVRFGTHRFLGSVSRKRLLGRRLRPGSKVEAFVTRPAWVGRYYALVFGRKGFRRVDGCLTAPTSSRRAPCP